MQSVGKEQYPFIQRHASPPLTKSHCPLCTTRPNINHNFSDWQLATMSSCSGSFNRYALQHIAYPANSPGLTGTLKLRWPVHLCPHKTVPLPIHVSMKSETDDGRVVWDLLAGSEGKSMLVLFTFQANVFESSSLNCSSPYICVSATVGFL